MPDRFESTVRSRIMAAIRGRDTGPEQMLRSILWRRGLRYRTHDRSVPGRPDLSHKASRVAVFIDGCFWHGCPRHYTQPATRRDFWDSKLARNKALRAQALQRLADDGWKTLMIWECDLTADPVTFADEVERLLRARRQSV